MSVLRLVFMRIGMAAVTLLLVSLIVFSILEILPGDVATRILGRDATPESLELLRNELGLNQPALSRYLAWLGDLLQGDLGRSLVSNRPVSEILGMRIYNTMLLSAYAFLVYLPLTTLPALLQAIWRDRPIDHAFSVVTLI
ncbi:MAG: ABC transporter permease, partial [Aestuariivirgaceae bacterium]